MKKLLVAFSGAIAWLLVFAAPALAIPPLPQAFYGDVTIAGVPAPVGTVVTAKIAGVEVGNILTTVAGKYGDSGPLQPKLVVEGDIVDGTAIDFFINGVRAEETAYFMSGTTSQLNLHRTSGSVSSMAALDDPGTWVLVASGTALVVVVWLFMARRRKAGAS